MSDIEARVKEKLDFYLQMEKEGFLHNWGGNEVVWLLEYLWSGGRFNDQKKHEWVEVLRDERDSLKQTLDDVIKHRAEYSHSRHLDWLRDLDEMLGNVQ